MPPTVSILVSHYRRHPNILSRLLCTLVNIYSSLKCCVTEWVVPYFNLQGQSVEQEFLYDWLTLKMEALHSFETSSKNRGSNPGRLESSATLLWKIQMCVSTVFACDWILTHSPFNYIKHSCHHPVAYRGGVWCVQTPPPKFRRYRWSPWLHEQDPAFQFPFVVHCVLIQCNLLNKGFF